MTLDLVCFPVHLNIFLSDYPNSKPYTPTYQPENLRHVITNLNLRCPMGKRGLPIFLRITVRIN